MISLNFLNVNADICYTKSFRLPPSHKNIYDLRVSHIPWPKIVGDDKITCCKMNKSRFK